MCVYLVVGVGGFTIRPDGFFRIAGNRTPALTPAPHALHAAAGLPGWHGFVPLLHRRRHR